jgi:hypothetical protein
MRGKIALPIDILTSRDAISRVPMDVKKLEFWVVEGSMKRKLQNAN